MSGRPGIIKAHDRTYVSAMKMCTRCSASFSYSRFASSTSRLRMSLLRATTLDDRVY